MTTVLVACPMGEGLVHEKFRESIFALNHTPLLYLFGRDGKKWEIEKNLMELQKKRWKVIADSRNDILSKALKLDWDYILWVDSDMEVYPTLIEDLLKHTTKEKIISAEYPYRKPIKPRYVKVPSSPLPMLNFNINQIESGGPDDHQNPPYKMWLGFGCMLIAREVHEKVGLFKMPIDAYVGEDVVYCKAMRDAGYNIFLSDIKVNHFPKSIEVPANPEAVLPSNYKKRKIVYVGGYWLGYGGTEATVRNIMGEMAKLGHECYAVHWYSDKPVQSPKVDGVTDVLIKEEDVTTAILPYIDEQTVVYTVLLPVPKVWQTVLAKGGRVVHEYNMPFINSLPANAIKIHDSLNFVFNSEWTKNHYEEHYGLKGTVINPLIDLSKYKHQPNLCKNHIGFINPVVQKGAKVVEELAKMMPDRIFSVCGGWRDEKSGKVREISGENVIFSGNLNDISDFYSTLDILLVPTQQHPESYGRVVLEAMNFDCAVIASKKDGLPEAMGDGGYLVDDWQNVESWKKAIEDVQNNITHYKELAKKRIGKYDYSGDIKKWDTVFQNAK